MGKLQIRIDDVELNAVTIGVLEQYLGDGTIVDAAVIDSGEGNIDLSPKRDWERTLTGTIDWLEKI